MVADDGKKRLPSFWQEEPKKKKLHRAQGTTKALLDHQGCLGSRKVGPVGFG